MNIKRYVGDKKFYGMVLAIAVPIMIQNGITNFVSLLDNIMAVSYTHLDVYKRQLFVIQNL